MNKNSYGSISFILSLCLFFQLLPRNLSAQEIYTEDTTLKRALDNGLTVVIHEMRGAPIAAIDLIVKTGSATEGRFSGTGISHFVEHMLFKEKSERGVKTNKEKMKSIGGEMNGFTSHHVTGFTAAIDSEYTAEALEILKSLVMTPAFDSLELKKERDVIVNEIRKNRDDYGRLALDLSWSIVFKEHPYKYPVIGYEDLLEQIGKEELEAYYRERYSPHNMVLGISGDVNKEAIFKKVETIFGPIKRKPVPSFSSIAEPPQASERSITKTMPISLSHVVLSFKSASISSPLLYPLDILATALGEGQESILNRELRDKKKLVYYITCQNYTLRDSGLFYIYFTADKPKVDEAIAAITEELERIKDEGIGAAGLKKSKKIAKSQLLYALETVENRARNMAISEAIANDYNFSEFYLNGLMGVEENDLKYAARAYLKKSGLNKVLILPEDKKKPAAAAEKKAKFEKKITKELMPNGAKIIVSENHSTPICSLLAVFLGGVRSENSENNGISRLVSKLLMDGTKDRSEEDIKLGIESKGGSIENISGKNTFGLRISLLSGDYKMGLDILSDAVTNSQFPQKKISKEKNLALAGIRERDDNIIESGILFFKQAFFKEHPYRFDPLGTKESVKKIKKEDIINYYKSLCVPKNMIITVSGDVDTKEAIEEVKKRFASFSAGEPILPSPPAASASGVDEVSKSMKKEQSLVIVGFPSVKYGNNDSYIFEVLSSIMSGSDGRLFSNIRENLGMAYMLGSYFLPGIEPGFHIFYAVTSDKNTGEVKSALIKEISRLKDKGVTEEELAAAKRYLIASHTSDIQRNSSLGLTMSLHELYGLGYDNFKTYSEKINNVTASQVKRVANRYFDNKKRLVAVIHGVGGNPR